MSDTDILLPAGVQDDRHFGTDIHLGRSGSLAEIQAYLASINYEINHLLMLNTVAANCNRADIVKWILENTPFDINPEQNHQYYILRYIVQNNSLDVLRVCLENETMRNILKQSTEIQTQITRSEMNNDIMEEYVGSLDIAIVESAEARLPTLALALYPYVSSTEYELFPYSVKHHVLIQAIMAFTETGRPEWFTLFQTILNDESYNPSFPHDNEPLNLAVQLNSVEQVKYMLNHPRIEICEDTNDGEIMAEVCEYSNTPNGFEVFKLFLQDERIDPSRDANQILHFLAAKGVKYNNALRHIVLSCDRIRWDWFGWPTPLTRCVKKQNIEGLRILLAQPRYDPCMYENEAMRAAEEIMDSNPEFMLELLDDERIARRYSGKGVLWKAKSKGKLWAAVKEELELAAMTPERIWNWYLTNDDKQIINTQMRP
jgi:hypothetical protein